MNYCTRCGNPEQPGARFCPTCGKRYKIESDGSFAKRALSCNLLGAATRTLTRMLEPASVAIERGIRRGVDALLAENGAAPSFLAWNVAAFLAFSVPCGLIGLAYSLRVLQIRENNDGSSVVASKYAKLWFALAVASFLLIRVPLCLKIL